MEVSESWIRKQATKLQLSIKEAAEFVGKGQQYVRVGLQKGRLKFGTAVPKFKDENEREARRRAGKHNWDYDIQRIFLKIKRQLLKLFQNPFCLF